MKEYLPALWGGALIGCAAVMMYGLNGRIMGVSGICSRLFGKLSVDSWWRIAFIGGLVVGGWVYRFLYGVEIVIDASFVMVAAAGLLVGFGTVLGNGCTSGHGICGIARLSKRSIVATIIFILAGIIVVWLRKTIGA